MRYAGPYTQSGYGNHCPVCVTPLLQFAELSPRPGPAKGQFFLNAPVPVPATADDTRRLTAYAAALGAMTPAERSAALADPLSRWHGPLTAQPWERPAH